MNVKIILNKDEEIKELAKDPEVQVKIKAAIIDGIGARAIKAVQDALAAPPRNCDRLECATTASAQAVWRKEDGGKTAYYEWLLATYKEGGVDGNE